MPIGVVNDNDFELELRRLRRGDKDETPAPSGDGGTVPSTATVLEIERGRGDGNKAIPAELRALIGIDAVENGSRATKALTKELGISDSSLSAYKHGATSTSSYHQPDSHLAPKVKDIKLKIADKARSRLLSSLKAITPEKLEQAKLRDVAAVAQAMSAVIKNTEPDVDNKTTNVNVVLYAPKVKSESDYEVIDASAE